MSIFQKETKAYDLSNLTVMVVEDSHSMQTLIASMLKAFGVGEILVCSGANEAIGILTVTQARFKTRHISGVDIILTDWLMPDGSRQELIDWVRAHEEDEIRFLPVILISAYTTEKVLAMARDHGANEALVKPVSGNAIASRILSVIDHPRLFVQAPDFFGPDRRRQQMDFRGEDRRKTPPEKIKVHHEKS